MLTISPPLKKPIYFFLTLHRGTFFENKKEFEFTHITEHLLFAGTSQLNGEKNESVRNSLFTYISARTQHSTLTIFGYFKQENLKPAFQYLHDMIYDWECSKEQWEKEKKILLKEYKKNKKKSDKNFVEIYSLFPEFIIQNSYWNNTSWFENGSYSIVKKMHAYWEKFLKDIPIQLSLIGNISEKESQYISKLFSLPQKKPLKKEKWKILAQGRKTLKQKNEVLWYKSPRKNVGSFFFEEILKQQTKEAWFLEIQDYSTFKFPKKIIPKILSCNEKDFLSAQKTLINEFETIINGADWFEFLDNAMYIEHHSYMPFQAQDIHSFTKALKKYTFEDYKKWWKETRFEELLK